MRYLQQNYYFKVNERIPTDLPLNTVWWYFTGQKVTRKHYGSRTRKKIMVFNFPLKKQILIRTLTALETLAYMKNRFLLLNTQRDEIVGGDSKYRIMECKEWIPGYFLRKYQEKPKEEDKIAGKRFLIRLLPKKFPTILINLLYVPADIQLAEANNINVLTFSFCCPTTKSFIISKFKVPFHLLKGRHRRLLRKIILRNILLKTNLILKKIALAKIYDSLLNISRYNKHFIKKLSRTLKKKKKIKLKIGFKKHKIKKFKLKKNIKKHLNKSKKLYKQDNKLLFKPFRKQNNKNSKFKTYNNYTKKYYQPKEFKPPMIKGFLGKDTSELFLHTMRHVLYKESTKKRHEKAKKIAAIVKVKPQTFIFGKQLK